MRSAFALSLAALVGCSLSASIARDEIEIQSPDVHDVSEDDVDRMDLYASYSASAPCNINTPKGELVTCYRNCDRAEADQPVILNTFHGELTEFAAYMAVVESRQQIVWVGRGSATPMNWCTNFNFTLIDNDLVDGGKVHSGFQTAWSEIADDVFATLLDAVAQYPDYSIVVTGGSLGGAVATLVAANIRDAGYDADLYTYGSPKIGNDVLSDFITNQPGELYRVTHRWDIVPRVPFTDIFPGWFGEYRHVSPEYYLTGEPEDRDHWPLEDIKVCKGNKNRQCIDNPLNFIWDIRDHTDYMGSLECWKPNDSKNIGFFMSDEILNTLEDFGPASQLTAGGVPIPIEGCDVTIPPYP